MKTTISIMLLAWALSTQAVQVNPQGSGQVALVPYFTVNNGLNTLVEVVNTTDQAKAIKINIKDLYFASSVLSYNVYLGPHDSWAFALAPMNMQVEGLAGEEGMVHFTSDTSCAPFLPRPLALSQPDIDWFPYELSRVREGFIEILEMATLEGAASLAVQTGDDQTALDCGFFEHAWSAEGQWQLDANADLAPVTGGLSVDVSLIDVAEGINHAFQAVSLSGFFPAGSVHHSSPDEGDFSLDSAGRDAWFYDGSGYRQLRFDRGIDAVSAVLMADEVAFSYDLEPAVAGLTELVLTLPTKEHHRLSASSPSDGYEAPFNVAFDVSFDADCPHFWARSGFGLSEEVFDRQGLEPPVTIPSPSLPRAKPKQICQSGLTFSFSRTDSITGSSLTGKLSPVSWPFATAGGYMTFTTLQSLPLIGTDPETAEQFAVWGMPVIGVVLQRYINANAGPGLLARYGGARLIKTRSRLEPVM